MAGEKDDLDKYINDLADIKDEPDPNAVADDNNDGGDDGQGEGDGNQQQQLDEQNADGTKQDQGADQNAGGTQQKGDGKKDKQPSKGKKGAGQDELRPLGDGTFTNQRGDIVDQSGKLIAQSGFAARMYHSNRRLKAQLDERSQQLNEIAQSVGEVRSLATSIQRYGLDNNEVAQAMDLAGRMKRGDVLGVAKEVLALIAAQGYNVTDLLGSEVGDSIELRAINNMINERLAPITRQEQDRQRQTEAAQNGKRAYDEFVAANDYADVHANDIVGVMKREGVNPQTAYNRLFQFATVNRLDFSKPLQPQVIARIQANQKQQQNKQQQKPMPNGAATRSGNGAFPAQPLASADDDWGTIISEVQRTIGNA